ncbi:uncharacterized protein GGS22DRAFT_113976 [Annulohypoxylon maeteangense]|uniref:uncharacterized protein n=1 Tax=Annulohypoxylon maeteangense TaxID=1927788 RepID=UPI002008559C|nr:uncharacterized protein GGS22DRAFT_113976 [Annulohypoxylon maeteangense]KAI0886468.1 hypothetical protein GGS22DRAFT_113976 [Annulohypoxylon maeteangense]
MGLFDLPPGTDPDTYPASHNPDGTPGDFNSPVNSAKLFYIVGPISLVLAVVASFLKIYIRAFVHKKFGIDDGLTLIALALQCVQVGWVIDEMKHGAVRHMWDMSWTKFLKVLRFQDVNGAIQAFAFMVAKLSIVFLFYRIFSPKTFYKWAIIVCGIIVFVGYATLAIASLCVPLEDGPTVLFRVSETIGAVGLVTDVYLAVLPIAAIMSLNLPRRRKIGVAAIFGAGFLGIAMAALSAYYRISPSETNNTTDDTYTFTKRITVQVVELDIAIIIGCVPIFPGLLRETIVTTWISRTFGSMTRLVKSRGSVTSHSESYYNLSGHHHPSSSKSAVPIPLEQVHTDERKTYAVRSWADTRSESPV